MHDLIEAHNTISFLKEHGISAKKRYGQNFLIDRRVLNRIIEGSNIGKEDTVLEIGPGIGTLTQALCSYAGRVIAVEIDRDMLPILEENLREYDNYEVINEDILKVDLQRLVQDRGLAGKRIKVAANLPYYITTPIIMQLLECSVSIESITVMVQKEVADRMQAEAGSPDYGALSLAVGYYAESRILSRVPSNCFIPRPNVDSAVICLRLREEPAVKPGDKEHMFGLIRAAFAQRRKTLVNALSNSSVIGSDRERTASALERMGLRADIRGEKLSLEQFSELSDILLSE